jgi:hypothetical protein
MQPVKINGIEYLIPLSWSEVKYNQAISILKNVDDMSWQLFCLSGITVEVTDKLTDQQATKLFQLISFTENLEVFESVEVKEEYKLFDFSAIQFGKAESCRKILTDSDSGFDGVSKCIKKLVDIDVNDKPFLEWIGTANFFLAKLLTSLIATPNLAKVQEAMSRNKPGMEDCIILEALPRVLSSQEPEHSAQQ